MFFVDRIYRALRATRALQRDGYSRETARAIGAEFEEAHFLGGTTGLQRLAGIRADQALAAFEADRNRLRQWLRWIHDQVLDDVRCPECGSKGRHEEGCELAAVVRADMEGPNG